MTVTEPRLHDRSTSSGLRTGDLLRLVRPRQWPKNLVAVTLPLIGGEHWSRHTLPRMAWAVALFTLAASVVYVINDLADRERDRLHPVKRARPIASGRVSVPVAIAWAALLTAASAALAALGPWPLAWPVAAYVVLNLLYSHLLKHIALVDVFVVAAGFALRVVLGSLADGIPLSVWLVLAVYAASVMISLGKRRQELDLGTAADRHRPTLEGYSRPFVDQMVVVTAVVAVLGYAGFLHGDAAQPFGQVALLTTMPFVLYGLFRYLQIVISEGGGGDPAETLLRDRRVVVSALLCFGCLAFTSVLAGHQELVGGLQGR
ncbi:decaprenyl-phosphate phosphoribosyltransferase [Streptomyces echinoruber]|uniref:Decaprenyl-phosphate phosphoribosyltransferase n=1 Tax=Streptomyces echinoruber TaxID=68898 RepID=A0A918V7P3_9ACTN|nr:decaprenyl-phosphate phosphoribosyltransferase [Streptomyces echinoruber]GGZ79321.1 decaprenyl-phosphate phosphoribosyltransferase [Streptomyces echinoruber]